MCENYKYMLQLKPEFDIKYQKTGIHTQLIYLCEVKQVARGEFKLHYDSKRFNLLVKECGHCHVCLYKKASIKAAQGQAEFKTAKQGSFITLTFGPDKMTEYIKTDKRFKNMSYYKKNKYINYLQWTLEKREFQLFMKRLRERIYQKDLYEFSRLKGYDLNYLSKNLKVRNKTLKYLCYDYSDFKPHKIRFLHSGEYGSFRGRPHHHAIIYGYTFPVDYKEVRYSYKQQKNVVVNFNYMLNDLWKFGDVTIGDVTYQSCNYVARYVTKKIYNENINDINSKDKVGFVYKGRLPEYCTQSNRRGLGYDFYMQNAKKLNKDLCYSFKNNKGEIKTTPLPRYFKELMKKYFKSDFLRMQKLSMEKCKEFSDIPADVLENRMVNDSNKSETIYSKFLLGNYDMSGISLQCQNYLTQEYKLNAFGKNEMKSVTDVYLKSYSDSDFVEKEKVRVKCYRNFENYKKSMISKYINDYVYYKHEFPHMNNLMLYLYDDVQKVRNTKNIFTFDNPDLNKYVFDGTCEYWYNYNRKELLKC